MNADLSAVCALIVEAHEAAELAVVTTADGIVTAYRASGGDNTPDTDAANTDYLAALDLLEHIERPYQTARQAMGRDALRSHPAARALRGV